MNDFSWSVKEGNWWFELSALERFKGGLELGELEGEEFSVTGTSWV